jgi:type VI secretion system protein ImpJ
MTTPAVHWHEGMFLQPHHFQTHSRFLLEFGHRLVHWGVHYNWGLHSIQIDPDALINSRLVIRSVKACFRDGTPISIPEDGLLPDLDLKPLFEPGKPLMIYLALPMLNLGKGNAADRNDDNTTRFKLDTLSLEDENTGLNPQPIRIRRLNVQLLLSGQDTTGYQTLPIVRLDKSTLVNAPPQIDASFIPPILSCDAWKILVVDILQSLTDRIGRKRERLASQLSAQGASVTSSDPFIAIASAQLRELNEAYTVLQVYSFSPGITPLQAYIELCRLVGQLLIFDRSGRAPVIPPYDHDDLGGCFYTIKRYLDDLLGILPDPEYKERPFIGMGMRVQVAVESNWLDPVWELFIGVRSELDSEELLRLLTVHGQLDMKLGASDRVDAIYQLGQAGLRFESCSRPERLPDVPGQRYFRVSRQPEKEWMQVQRSLSLAVRINETRIVGNLQNEPSIRIRTGANLATLQFTLFAVPTS